ncbi:hypothetical protein DMN91_001617 [Ooceraea biroi]|uniref:Uncharacterized protein n=1 Tax=Ooceraea biroi TaxID=2015173 RepID=A0A026W9H6_OOCBI|nr:uncharacterized protein LOC105281724 [Ooceraea biroi]EZA52762.1 hypothetical protein X777_07143 [Ooceraea biroi]RLU25461.1 hypothetical protein DMN91_001617 [Ooceraea biroi]
MKEQWKVDDKQQLAALEEGRLQEKKQEQAKNSDYENGCCSQECLQIILFLGCLLFCGWCFYVTYQNFRSEKIENQISNTIRETYHELMYEPQPETQKSQPNTESSVIFVEPEIFINKLNVLLEETDLLKEQDTKQDEATATDGRNTNAPSFINESDNVVQTSDLGLSMTALPENLHKDSTYDDTETFFHKQLLGKLHNGLYVTPEIINDAKEPENRNVFTEDNILHLTLNSHESDASSVDVSNNLESSRSDVTTISNLNDLPDHTVTPNLMNNSQDRKQKVFDFIETTAQDDQSDINFYNPYLLFDPESLEYLTDDSSISRSVSTQETSKHIENKPNYDIDAANKDRHDIDDSDLSMSENASSADEHIGNIKDWFEFWLPPPTMQDSIRYPWMKSDSVEDSSVFKLSGYIADNPQLKSKDTTRSSETSNPFSSGSQDTEMIEDVIPGNRCKVEITSGILKVKCPAIKFSEEWDLSSSESSTRVPSDVSHDNDNYRLYFENIDDYYTECDEDTASQSKDELISTENSDIKKSATSQYDDARTMVALEKSTPSVKISNGALLETVETDSSANTKDSSQDDAIYNTNEKELTTVPAFVSNYDFDTTKLNKQWNQLKIAELQKSLEEQDYLSGFIDTFKVNNLGFKKAKPLEAHKSGIEKKLGAIYDDEMNTLKRMHMEMMDKYGSTEENVDMCKSFPYMCRSLVSDTPIASRESIIYPHDSLPTFRKKRMTDNLTWQQEVSNALKEDSETADLLKNLERVYQKLEILAICIDKFHERYLLHNKLDDDYI